MDEIRIGVAGLGHRGLHWIRLLQSVPGYRITAIYDWIGPLQERALSEIAYRDDVKGSVTTTIFWRTKGWTRWVWW